MHLFCQTCDMWERTKHSNAWPGNHWAMRCCPVCANTHRKFGSTGVYPSTCPANRKALPTGKSILSQRSAALIKVRLFLGQPGRWHTAPGRLMVSILKKHTTTESTQLPSAQVRHQLWVAPVALRQTAEWTNYVSHGDG